MKTDQQPGFAVLLITCKQCGFGKAREEIEAGSKKLRICGECFHGPRECNVCHVRKEAQDFFARGKANSHCVRRTTCRECVRLAYERTKANAPRFLFDRVRHRAKREGTAFTITIGDIFIPEHCPILGIKLAPVGDGQTSAAPTLDRIDASKGYVPGNVAVISRLANAMKGRATAAEHERIAAWMRSVGAP